MLYNAQSSNVNSFLRVEATSHKNALIKNLLILFVFFCTVEPIYILFLTDSFLI